MIAQSATSVTIRATSYLRSDTKLAPAAPGASCTNSPGATFQLQPSVVVAGIDGRKLLDAATSKPHSVLDARQVASPSFVPSGFVDQGLSWNEAGFAKLPQVTHTYRNAIGLLTVSRLDYRDVTDLPNSGSTSAWQMARPPSTRRGAVA